MVDDTRVFMTLRGNCGRCDGTTDITGHAPVEWMRSKETHRYFGEYSGISANSSININFTYVL